MKFILVIVFSPPFLFFLHETDFCLLSLLFSVILPFLPHLPLSSLPFFLHSSSSTCGLCVAVCVFECVYINILSNCHLLMSLEHPAKYLKDVIFFSPLLSQNAKIESKPRRPPEPQKRSLKNFSLGAVEMSEWKQISFFLFSFHFNLSQP